MVTTISLSLLILGRERMRCYQSEFNYFKKLPCDITLKLFFPPQVKNSITYYNIIVKTFVLTMITGPTVEFARGGYGDMKAVSKL